VGVPSFNVPLCTWFESAVAVMVQDSLVKLVPPTEPLIVEFPPGLIVEFPPSRV